MSGKLREKYLNNLVDCANSIAKRLAEGQQVTCSECLFLRMVQREIRKSEQIPVSDIILQNADKLLNFAKSNLAGLLNSAVGG